MKTISIHGHDYRITKPDPMSAWQIHRKGAQLAVSLFNATQLVKTSPEAIPVAFNIVAPAFASISLQDGEWLVSACLRFCYRREGENFSQTPCWNNQIAYSDMTPVEIDILVTEVVMLAFENFTEDAATYLLQGLAAGTTGS